MPIYIWFYSRAILSIPENIEQIIQIEELIALCQYQKFDSPKLTLFYKTLKAARLVMFNKIVLNRTNIDLLAAKTQKKWQV